MITVDPSGLRIYEIASVLQKGEASIKVFLHAENQRWLLLHYESSEIDLLHQEVNVQHADPGFHHSCSCLLILVLDFWLESCLFSHCNQTGTQEGLYFYVGNSCYPYKVSLFSLCIAPGSFAM